MIRDGLLDVISMVRFPFCRLQTLRFCMCLAEAMSAAILPLEGAKA